MANSIKKPRLSTNALIALSAVAVALVVIIVLVFGRSLIKRIGHNNAVITKKASAEKQLKQNLANLPGLSQAYSNLGPTKTVINDALPTTASFPDLVATIESIAGTSGVALQSVSPALVSSAAASSAAPTSSSPSAAVQSINGTSSSTTSVQPSGPQPYQFSMSIQGNYDSLVKFLHNLQLSARPIIISGVQVTGTNDALTATVTGQTFYFNPQVLEDKTEVVK
ncbi:MAG TPA: hypothetical protein VLE72_01235 [Candidatus Saccharimonadales bacterium]|nr:hypothetical protein [Candidatus Saccharimonadales bacterium]